MIPGNSTEVFLFLKSKKESLDRIIFYIYTRKRQCQPAWLSLRSGGLSTSHAPGKECSEYMDLDKLCAWWPAGGSAG